MESHNCLSCNALISTLFFYCWQCRQNRARMAKEARKLPSPVNPPAGDALGFWRQF